MIGKSEHKTKDEIRFNHAVMEYDHAIKFCKEVLASGVTGETLEYTKKQLEEAEQGKKKLLESHK